MANKTTIASVVGTIIAGPALAGAEASGTLAGLERSIVVYICAGAATLFGSMVTILVWFLKREHSAITGGIKSTGESLHGLKSTMNAMALNVEELSGDLKTDLAQRVKLSDFRESMNTVHDKINRQGKALSYIRAKMGLPLEEE